MSQNIHMTPCKIYLTNRLHLHNIYMVYIYIYIYETINIYTHNIHSHVFEDWEKKKTYLFFKSHGQCHICAC